MPLDIKNGLVELAHGSGGRATNMLIDELFLPAFDNPILQQKNDQAHLSIASSRIVTATDSHVVSPLFFPGGDIGCLSVYGTVNDIVLSGAKATALSAGFILEEGFPLQDLHRIVQSMARAAKECGVQIVTGDTKVVERGKGDGVYINTSGIGVIEHQLELGSHRICAGDKILLSGSLGDHGVTIMSQREQLGFSSDLQSDCQPLHDLIHLMIEEVPEIHCMRDPTRGGLAASLNELANTTGFSIHIEEQKLPIKASVKACAELLGLDPLYIANEGKLIAFCPAEKAETLLSCMRAHPKGKDSAIIGEVMSRLPAEKPALVHLKTSFGGTRLLDWRYSDPLPRIC
jgi:hydrogenase expression/formation protein HypE